MFGDASATPHFTYWYRVRAFNGAGILDYSPQISFTVSPPRQPFVFPTQIGDGVNLFFHGQDAGVKGFKLERAPDSGGTPSVWTQIATFASSSDLFRHASGSVTDSNLVPLATYWYRVRAFNWVGDSEYSEVATVTMLPPIITTIEVLALLTPLRITQLTLTNHSVLLTWTATAGTTNVVEATSQPTGGFAPVSPNIILSGHGSVITNYLDVGALTNSASRFYRIRLVP